MTDNLVTEDHRQLWIRQLAIDNVKIGAANCADTDANEKLSPADFWFRNIAQDERRSDFLENHRAHRDVSTGSELNGNSAVLRSRFVSFF